MSTSMPVETIAGSVVVDAPLCELDAAKWERNENRRDLYLDVLERILVVGLFGWLVVRLLADFVSEGNLGSVILLPSEGLVVVFMVIRRASRTMSRSVGVWLMAL